MSDGQDPAAPQWAGEVELEPYWEFLAAGLPQISFHFCPDQLLVFL